VELGFTPCSRSRVTVCPDDDDDDDDDDEDKDNPFSPFKPQE